MIKVVIDNKLLFIPIILTMLYFIRKAVQYAMIDSYGTLIIVITFLFLFLMNIRLNRKRCLLVVRMWAILLVIWASARIFIAMMNIFMKTFDEYHLNNQFGISKIIISLTMLLFGIMIIRQSHRKRLKGWL